ncbi:MAG: MOSC domain-containing protein, partial [Rhizobacter sp.]|nr:MOSC domain-containing protein [Bacteriovorax sp.]
MKIESIQIGMPKTVEFRGKQISTGIFKDRIKGPVILKTLSLEGDGQADLRVHGGVDKALYAYPFDTYNRWRKLRPDLEFTDGAFGENLSMSSLQEDSIYIGDIYELGEAIVQVTQPRFPCYKLGVKFKESKIIKQFMEFDRPGVYFRVLKEGIIDVGDELKLVSREKVLLSVLELFHIQDFEEVNKDRIREILQ